MADHPLDELTGGSSLAHGLNIAPCHCDDAKYGLRGKRIDRETGARLRRTRFTTIVLLCAAAAVAGCSQVTGLAGALEDASFKAPDLNLPDLSFGNSDATDKNFDLGPKGPVSAENLISATGYCAPAAAPAAPAAQTTPPAQPQAQAAAAPPPDRLQTSGFTPTFQAQPQLIGGVSLGMSECAVARRLGTPGNVSISAGPKGERRVVLTYPEGNRPGLYSFRSGRLIQVDATPQQAAKPGRTAKKPARRKRTRQEVQRMYVQ